MTNSSAPLSGRVTLHKGKPTLFVDDQPMLAMIYALTDSPGGRWSWEEVPQWNIRQFAEQGIRLFYVDIWLEYIWFPDRPLDIELVRRQMRGVLDVCPDAAIFIRLHVNSPPWWNAAHPDECVAYANGPVEEQVIWGLHRPLEGDLDRTPRHSMASAQWLADAGDKLQELCQALAAVPEGDRLVGLHLAAGVFHEWHYYGFIEHEPDTGPAMTAYFRRWLRDKYGDDETLRRAWNDADVTLATAEVPGVAARLHTSEGYFRDPQKERPVVDYFECHQLAVADAALHFCRLAKQHWPRPLVTGLFYGYFFTMFGRMVTGGHLQIERVLESPYVDFLSAPQSYIHRGLGGSGQSRGLLASARLHGKLWLDEMDHEPFIFKLKRFDIDVSLANALKKDPEFADALRKSVGVLRRSVAQPLCHGMGLWFFDFGPKMTTGWWDHPDLLAEIKQLRALFDGYVDREFDTDADVLLVYDAASFYYLGHNKQTDPVSPVVIDETSRDMYRSGVALDIVYLSDLPRVDWQKYKVVVFANTFFLRAEQRDYIRQHVARDGRHLVWLCAPGYTDGQRLGVDLVADASGIAVRKTSWPAAPQVQLEDGELSTIHFGLPVPVEPLFVVEDAAAVPVGRLAGSEQVALARKQLDDSTAWFCSLPLLDPRLMRWIFEQAGAHVYADDGDVLYSGGGVVCVHSAEGGERTLRLRGGVTVRISLQPGDTALLDSRTGRALVQ